MTSRQRRWQIHKVQEGRCVTCGKPRGDDGTKSHCRKCADKWNQYKRDRRVSYSQGK